jgi:hypothetical protein
MYSGQGQVSQVSEKPFTDKWGKNITLYSFQLQGDNKWYRTGTNRPNCNQGDNISFVWEAQGNNSKVDPNSIQGGQAGAPQQQPQAQPQQYSQGTPPPQQVSNVPQPVAAPAATRDTYWKDKETYDKSITQPRIAYAAAQKSAVAIVTTALAHDVLGFGSAKKADKMAMLIGYVKQVTIDLAMDLDNAHIILKDAKAEVANAPEVVNEEDMYAA